MPEPLAFEPVSELRAVEPESAVLLDSPHSGANYPADFRHSCERRLLRSTEDAYVDALVGFAPLERATLIRAHFPRSYIDPNRSCDEIDPLLIDPHADAELADAKSRLGMGLVWRAVAGQPIYNSALTPEDITHRIASCWRPYHEALRRAWKRILSQHGYGIHLNCHSMPSVSRFYGHPPRDVMPYDFVIGTRDGTTACDGLTRLVVDHLRAQDHHVGLNDPFKGVELIRLTGNPASHRHALQIEVNKRLYMDEHTMLPHEGFAAVQDQLRSLVQKLVSLSADDVRSLG